MPAQTTTNREHALPTVQPRDGRAPVHLAHFTRRMQPPNTPPKDRHKNRAERRDPGALTVPEFTTLVRTSTRRHPSKRQRVALAILAALAVLHSDGSLDRLQMLHAKVNHNELRLEGMQPALQQLQLVPIDRVALKTFTYEVVRTVQANVGAHRDLRDEQIRFHQTMSDPNVDIIGETNAFFAALNQAFPQRNSRPAA